MTEEQRQAVAEIERTLSMIGAGGSSPQLERMSIQRAESVAELIRFELAGNPVPMTAKAIRRAAVKRYTRLDWLTVEMILVSLRQMVTAGEVTESINGFCLRGA